eukprot:13863954-Alexandrium_andersonii.AAC.1
MDSSQRGGAKQRAAARHGAGSSSDPPLPQDEDWKPPQSNRRKRKPTDIADDPKATHEQPDPSAEYRKHIIHLYLRNKSSALDTKISTQLAQKAGARGAEALATPTLPKHSQRSLMRALLKNTSMPNLYFAK